jgi:hypothetical protein
MQSVFSLTFGRLVVVLLVAQTETLRGAGGKSGYFVKKPIQDSNSFMLDMDARFTSQQDSADLFLRK